MQKIDRPLRILMTNLFLQGATGSETFVVTLARELKKMGHDVHIYCHNWGWYGDQVRKEGFECWYNPNEPITTLPRLDFDVVHFQHRETVFRVYDLVKHIPKLFICHGILPAPEQPLAFSDFPMEGYLGVSEETLENVVSKAMPEGNVKKTVLRNLIDVERFSSNRPIKKKLTKVLIISNYMQRKPAYIQMVQQACFNLQVSLEIIGDAGKRVPDTRPYIENADLVIGLGRCAYEAMAMGRNVMVFDYQGMDGMITSDEDYFNFRKHNLSGRYKNHTNVMFAEVLAEMQKYDPKRGDKNKRLIHEYHDSQAVAFNALEFYKQICNKS